MHGVWVGNRNQPFFVPNYGIESNHLRLGNPNSCTNRTIHSDESSGHRVSDSNNQGLSLSLSLNSQCSKPLRAVSNHSSNAGDRTDYRNVEYQQLAWRPQQKGLPERAVSVLRAWLFDHFLNSYPTDVINTC
ncbi:hypothetical protein QN277_008159 [Acacia crassicarpa]|uniref:Uncharacterized protein n=1 Tax=Acacia crassicarpa TaxID=499986 RepID=A0AAE1IRM4_9FABA|nr:hypothetical protein QN277_008159 [Acacia crassicarpa]